VPSLKPRPPTPPLPPSPPSLPPDPPHPPSPPAPPPFAPAPPSPPPLKPGGLTGDPHLHFAHGGEADFRGEDGAVYAMLHHAGLAVNAQFEASAFFLTAPHNLKVRGTFVTDLFIKVQTEPSGRELRIEFTPNAPPTPLVHSVLGSAQHLAPGESHSLDGVSIAVSGRADHLYVVTPGWAINVTARLIRRSATPGKRQIDLACVPLRDPLAPLPGTGRAVAPHGLIGQSFDGDRVAVDGRKDHYRELWWRQTSFRAWEITTEAQAEGAIEGSGDDYKVRVWSPLHLLPVLATLLALLIGRRAAS